jgi:hypothetical protein
MPSENYILLERTELNASAASVTFANIPQSGYTDLKVVISGRDSSSVGTSDAGYSFTILPNGLSTNISQRSIFGAGSGTPGSYTDTQMYNPINMNADTASTYSNVEIYVPNYTSSNFKSFSIDGVTERNATGAAARLAAGLWSSTAAITSLQFNAYSTWMANSTFSLYGIAAVGTTPAIAPKASGGNIIDFDGTYWIHTFLTSGTFTPQTGLSCDVLVVAGGGGGGSFGGGGAGGYRTETGLSVASLTNYGVTVGAGGSASSSGSNSIFSSITSAGGGAGGDYSNTTMNGTAGGSGGGGGTKTGGGSPAYGPGTGGSGNTPSTSPSQGNSGGTGDTTGNGAGGAGGGGATAAGGNFTGSFGTGTATGGVGGNGTANSISGTSITYAGGGGGAGYNTAGTAGTGGGGTGARGLGSISPTVGTINRGSGGGGGYASTGAAGGSGIVIIRYPAA